MRLVFTAALAWLALTAIAEDGDGGKHSGAGVHSAGKVGAFDYLQANEIVLPDMDFGKAPTGPNSYSFRKTQRGMDPNAFGYADNRPAASGGSSGTSAGGASQGGASQGGAGDGSQPPTQDLNKLNWKESSTALVKDANGTTSPQVLQFGYDPQTNQIQGVRFSDGTMVSASIPSSVPLQLRTVNGGFRGNIGGREVSSLTSEGQRGSG
jgi:hypothetical protein